MAFEFYIDGQLTDQPVNDTQLVTKIMRDNDLKNLTKTQEVQLIYAANNNPPSGTVSGYAYLKSLFDDAICNEAELKVYDIAGPTTTRLIYTGVIKLVQLNFEEQVRTITTRVQDNSFWSYINNNKDLKVDLRAVLSKNKVPVTEIDKYDVDMFDSYTGAYGLSGGLYYRAYSVYDVFAFIVTCISDGKVGFASDYLADMDYPLFLMKGISIVTPVSTIPSQPEVEYLVSFSDLFIEIDKIKNIFFYIDDSDPDAPILRIEDYESGYGGTLIYSFNDIKEITTRVDTDRLIGNVQVGSDVTADGVTPTIYTFNEATSYYGYKLEGFFPLGQCNNSALLNLINSYVISNNVIEECLYGSTSYNDNYFIIECNNVDNVLLTAKAVQWLNIFGTPASGFYNQGINNFNKLQRHSTKFETAFGNFLGLGDDSFKALLGDNDLQDITYMTGAATNPNYIPPGGLNDVDLSAVNETTNGGFDGNNNYSNITYEYTVPVDGTYSFHEQLVYEIDGLVGLDYFQVYADIKIYDSGMTLKQDFSTFHTRSYNAIFDEDVTAVYDCVAGDIVKAFYSIIYEPNQSGNQQIARTLTVFLVFVFRM